MWVFTMPRNPHDIPFVLNLDHATRINLNVLGERWFVEVVIGAEAVPVATARTQQEAAALQRRLFDSLARGDRAVDLNAAPAEDGK